MFESSVLRMHSGRLQIANFMATCSVLLVKHMIMEDSTQLKSTRAVTNNQLIK